MMLLKLTSQGTGVPRWVNRDLVDEMSEHEGGAVLSYTAGSDLIFVNETPEQIVAMIADQQRAAAEPLRRIEDALGSIEEALSRIGDNIALAANMK